MDPSFVFDLGDDAPPARPAQSPWDFGNAAKLVDEEHSQHRTTSIDHKIREQLRRRTIVRGSGFKDSGGGAKEESEEEDQIEEESDEEEEEEEAEILEANGNGLQGNGNDGVGGGSEQAESSDDEDSSDENDELEEKWEQKARARSHAEATSSKPALPDKQVRRKNGRAETNEGGPSSKGTFFSSSEGASFTARSFGELNISRPLLKACQALGYEKPTPIQSACVPLALTGRDICGSAITGSGKTAAFALPILERLLYRPRRVPATRVLVLTPTRELAVQVHSMIEKLAQFTDIRACLVVGGLSNKVQETALRLHPDVVVATPGRIIDHVRNTQSVGLEDLAILVLDEADRLLEMGFVDEVKEIVRNCPKKRQTLLFSATMTDEVNQLITMSLRNPVRLSADPKTRRPGTLVEEVVKLKPSQEADKEALLLALCTRNFRSKTIIFSATKSEAHRLKILFGLAGLRAAELHGNLTQAMRLQALETFRQQEADYLICTDVAARGLDIMGVETVVNFDCPKDITKYVHRVGRTARAGQNGCAVTFATEKDRALLKAVVKQAGRSLRSRQVAAAAVAKCRDQIERLEEDIREVMQEEQEERALRKAEMEVNKASNMVEHEAEIYSRPPKTWFQSPKDRKQAAETAKKAAEGGAGGEKQVESALSAKDRRALEKKKAEKEKRLPRKKRRRLEAERQIANDQAEMDGQVDEPKRKRSKQDDDTPKTSMVDVGYRKAKGAKSIMKLKEAGLLDPRKVAAMKGVKGKKVKKKVRPEGQEGGQESGAGSGGPSPAGGLKKKEHMKPRKAFKSKKRYKRK